MSDEASLSPLEQRVMQILWACAPCTAEEVRTQLAEEKELKDSTVRTVLRRIEAKGFASHRTEGRTYVYRPNMPRRMAAARAARRIVERLCGGSVEALLVGMVDDRLLDSQTLRELAATIERSEENLEGVDHD